MPFTISHIGAVLPFKQTKNVSSTALIVGSIVPDFGFYLLLRESSQFGHSLLGVVLLNLPLSLIVCYLFHNILRNMLIVNLPLQLQKRIVSYLSFNWNEYARSKKLVIISSILIGIFSHLFIDGFTHEDGFFTSIFPSLSSIVEFVDLPVYYVLQVSLSILGLLLVLRDIVKMPKSTIKLPTDRSTPRYWSAIFAFSLLIFTVRVIFFPQYNTYWGVVMALIGATMYGWMITSTLFFNKFSKSFSYARDKSIS